MWPQPCGPLGVPGQSRDVAGNWIYVEVVHPFFLAVVLRHRIKTRPLLGHVQLFHSCSDIIQVPVCGGVPGKHLSFVICGKWRFGGVQYTGGLDVLQRP